VHQAAYNFKQRSIDVVKYLTRFHQTGGAGDSRVHGVFRGPHIASERACPSGDDRSRAARPGTSEPNADSAQCAGGFLNASHKVFQGPPAFRKLLRLAKRKSAFGRVTMLSTAPPDVLPDFSHQKPRRAT